jgi:hypothetical protein
MEPAKMINGDQEILSIIYEDEQYKNGEIDIKQFAPSLLGFGEILEEINTALNDNNVSIRCVVRADFEKKCFKCDIVIKETILQYVQDFFISHHVKIPAILEVAGFILPYSPCILVISSWIVWKSIANKKSIISNTVLEDGNVAVVLESEENNTTTHKITFNLFSFIKYSLEKKKEIKINKAYSNHFLPSGDIQYRDSKNNIYHTVSKEDKQKFLNTSDDKKLDMNRSDQQKIKTILTIRSPDYTGDVQWKFLYEGDTISANFSEKITKKNIADLKKQTIHNTKFEVEMIIQWETNEDGEKINKKKSYLIDSIVILTAEKIQLELF